MGMHGDWEKDILDAFVAVCGEEEAMLRAVSALVSILKHPEASELGPSLQTGVVHPVEDDRNFVLHLE
jgi:hypothetical protein